MKTIIALLFSTLSMAAFSADESAAAATEQDAGAVEQYQGEARDLKTGALLYHEQHTLIRANGQSLRREVRYTDASGQLLAVKENTYYSPLVPDFNLQDKRRDYRESLSVRGDSVSLQLQEPQQKTRQRKLPLSDNMVADAGFDELVRQHWTKLLAGKRVDFDFVSVARLNTIGFSLHKTGETESSLILSMRLSSSLLSWLLDPIELEYDKSQQRLLRFRGLTNISDTQGEHYQAEIIYRYP